MVDRDTDSGSQQAGDTSSLELGQGEATASTDLAVVLDGRATDNRAQQVNGAGSDGGGLGLARDTTAVLLAGL